MSDVGAPVQDGRATRWASLRRRVWQVGRLIGVAAIVGGFVYWTRFAPVVVDQQAVRSGEIVVEVFGTGTLEARVKTTIGPKISGRIKQVRVDQGDWVVSGQVLVELDDHDFRQQVAIAQASAAASQAAVDRLMADRNRADAVLAQARRDHKRLQNLLSRGNASGVEFDKAVETLSVAEAELARAEAAIAEGRKQLVAAEETLAFHQARLADTVITAPFDGLITQRDREPGDVVVPGSKILSLISTEEMWISAWVDETAMARLKPGQPARVVFRSEPERPHEGKVVRLGREVDRETREFIVDVRVESLPGNWAVGQRAEAYIETVRKANATLLPAELIVRREDRPGVFVLVEGRAKWCPLGLGLRGRESVEVLHGLTPGQAVITPSNTKTQLVEGRRVKVR